ncbi:hypothetical protein D3C76_1875260 [compost metagenome]
MMNRPEVMIAGAPALFDAQGQLMDERTREQLRGLLEAFYVWIIKHKAWPQER